VTSLALVVFYNTDLKKQRQNTFGKHCL